MVLSTRILLLSAVLLLMGAGRALAHLLPTRGQASWYGEAHRGKLMANGQKFDPDKLTAASWFYALGTRLRVTLDVPGQRARAVVVTITDRGPAEYLRREGRIIDLAHAAFKKLAPPEQGLVQVRVEPVR